MNLSHGPAGYEALSSREALYQRLAGKGALPPR